MDNPNQKTGVIAGAIAAILAIILIAALAAITVSQNKQTKIAACEKDGRVYDEAQKSCREKTTSEKFAEKCTGSKYIDGKSYSCAELKRLGLEKAYLNNTIIKHGNTLYERGTSAEIAAGKQLGEYCLSADDAWSHIGEMRCVVFSYTQLSCSNGYCFLNEKKNYKTGFVAFFGKYNMYSWQGFQDEYKSGVSNILVCGQIKLYQGHPEIRITDPSRQVIKNPTKTNGAYAYSCKAAE